MRLQAIARQLATQRAYEMKINRRNRIAKEILETERSYVKSYFFFFFFFFFFSLDS